MILLILSSYLPGRVMAKFFCFGTHSMSGELNSFLGSALILFLLTSKRANNEITANTSNTHASDNWLSICRFATVEVIIPPIPNDNIPPKEATEPVCCGKHSMHPTPVFG